jgi:AcrR family transcriptional regulator
VRLRPAGVPVAPIGPRYGWRVSRAEALRSRGRPSSATKEQFLDAAADRFLAGERVEIQAICSELGLSRATIHRWFGSRDRVLGEVMVRLVARLFRRIDRTTAGVGADRLVDVFEQQLRALAEDRAFRRFLEFERDAAQRILTTSDGVVEPQVVDLIRETIEAEVLRGYEPPADPGVVAYAIVRMAESFLYADASSGFQGNYNRLRAVYAALLGARCESGARA